MMFLANNVDPDILTIKEAKESSDWPNWQKAIDEELYSLESNKTWTVSNLPKGRTPIGCRFVLK